MCGIAGHSCWGDYDARLDIATPILALFMESRGRKSFGWTDGKDQVYKSLGEISDTINPTFYGYKQAALHTRHPTTGNLVKENSHPFRCGDVLGMHNGVVRNHDVLQKKYNRKCEVDSEHIFHHVNEGLDLGEISAYGAIVYWKDGILHLGRFNGGELTLVKTETAWVFASTKVSIEVALRSAGLSDKTKFVNLEEDKLYTLDGDKCHCRGKLNFGSYNISQYGGWEGGYGQYSGFTNNYGIDWESEGIWTEVKNAEGEVIKKVWSPKKPTPAVVTGFVNHNTPRTSVRSLPPALLESSLKTLSNNERVLKLIEDAAQNVDHEHKGESWPCTACGTKLFDGNEFHITDEDVPQIYCCTCANLDPTAIINETPLTELPEEIGLVSSFFHDQEQKNEKPLCEVCAEPFNGDDFFVLTKNKEYLCVQCFAEAGVDQEYMEFMTESSTSTTDDITKLYKLTDGQYTDDVPVEVRTNMEETEETVGREDLRALMEDEELERMYNSRNLV